MSRLNYQLSTAMALLFSLYDHKKELYNKQLRIIQLENFELECEFYTARPQHTDKINPDLAQLITYIEKILADTIC